MTYIPCGSTIVGPLSQASTSTMTAVANAIIDVSQTENGNVSFSIAETGGLHAINFQMQASLDGMSWFNLPSNGNAINQAAAQLSSPSGGSTTALLIPAGTQGLVTYNPILVSNLPLARYYQVMIADNTAGSHGVATVNGYGH